MAVAQRQHLLLQREQAVGVERAVQRRRQGSWANHAATQKCDFS